MLTGWKKLLAWGLLFCALAGGTMAVLLRGQELGQLTETLRQASLPWLAAGVGAMALFFACEGRNLRAGLALFGGEAFYPACFRYGITGFFFSSITPSSSGGQPMQLYAMHRDGHGSAAGSLALLTSFFTFQFASLTWGCMGLALHHGRILEAGPLPLVCFFLGVGLSLGLAAVLVCAVVSKTLLPKLGGGCLAIVRRFSPGKGEALARWGSRQWEDLRRCLGCYRQNKKALVGMAGTALVQLAAYHSVPFFVYRAFGLSGEGLLSLLGLQAVLYVSVSSLPLPGAVGLSEGGFLLLYGAVFPPEVLSGALLLSRGVSFYLPLAVSGIALAVYSVFVRWNPLSFFRPIPKKDPVV